MVRTLVPWTRIVTIQRLTLLLALLAFIGVTWLALRTSRLVHASHAQLELAREHHRVMVRPLIRVSSLSDERRTGIFIRNHGLGPAIVEGFEIKLRGRTYSGDVNQWGDVLTALGHQPACYTAIWPRAGEVYAIGEENRLIVLSSTVPGCRTGAFRLLGRRDGFSMQLHYQSLYGEHFTWSGNSLLEAPPFSM